MNEFPISLDDLTSLLGDLNGPMVQPEGDRIAYINAPPTRRELFEILVHVFTVNASALLVQTSQLEGNETARLENLKVAFEQNEKLAARLRELLNAGVDPEWSPHS
jgi:hypothetical protein